MNILQLVTVFEFNPSRQPLHSFISVHEIGHDRYLLHSLCPHTLSYLNHGVALSSLSNGLPARHRDRIVVENFVSDIDPCGHALTNGYCATVKVRAVAHIGKDVLFFDKRLLSNPRCSLTPHLRKSSGASVHPQTHEMTANSCHCSRTLGHYCAGVVRTTRAKPGLPLVGQLHLKRALLFCIQGLNMRPHCRAYLIG